MTGHSYKPNYAWRTQWSDGYVKVLGSREKKPPTQASSRIGSTGGHGLVVDCHLVPLEALNKPTEKKKHQGLLKLTSNGLVERSIEEYNEMSTSEIVEELELHDKDKNVEMYEDKEKLEYINEEQDYELVEFVAEIQSKVSTLGMRVEKLFEFISDNSEVFDSEFLLYFVRTHYTVLSEIQSLLHKIEENLEK